MEPMPKYFICQYCGRGYPEEERIARHMYDAHLKTEDDKKRAVVRPEFSFPANPKNQLKSEKEKSPVPLNSNVNGAYYADENIKTDLIKKKKEKSRGKSTTTISSSPSRRKQSLPKKNVPIEISSAAAGMPRTTTVKNQKSATSRVKMVKMGQVKNPIDFPCSSCPKSFSSAVGLQIHNRRHDAQSPKKKSGRRADKLLKCLFCTKSFTQHANRQAHHRIHTGERPYVCNFGCGRTFTQLSHLNQHHEAIHIQEKPFKCEFCCHQFSQLNNMKIHVNKMHGKIPGEPEN